MHPLAIVLAAVQALAAEALPPAEVDLTATPMAAVADPGGSSSALRVGRGRTLALQVSEPAALRIEVRAEGAVPPGAVPVSIEMDGRVVSRLSVRPVLEDRARSDRGLPVTRAVGAGVAVPAGRHQVTVRWPSDAPGDALVSVGGVSLRAASLAQAETHPRQAQAPSRAEAPTVAAPGPAPDEAGALPAPRRWVRLLAGAARTSESYTAPAAASVVALEGGLVLAERFSIFARADNRLYRQEYVTAQPAVGASGAARASLSEQRWEAQVGGGYDVGPSLAAAGGLRLVPMVGAHYLALRNGALPADLAGPEAGVAVSLRLGPGLAFETDVRFTYGVTREATLSAMGRPISQTSATAGFAFPAQGAYALELLYVGDFLAFEHDWRIAHGAVLGMRAAF